MPSMKCHECHEVKRCQGVPTVGEHGRVTLVYLCKPCKREWDKDQKEESSDA